MTDQYKKLISILEELFQLNQADLDFGIYRIMNQKRAEVIDFLHNRLLKQVTEILSRSSQGEAADVKKELDKLEATLREVGVDPDTNTKVQELRHRYATAGNPDVMAGEVFSHLTAFFRRYYSEGDFISMRRYKKDVYALPYEGEEVKLHWANHDQYYIKTGENFKNYTFSINGGKQVSFALRDASTERDNNKAQGGKERRFKLVDQDLFTEEADKLTIWFTYEPTDKKEKQSDLNAAALEAIRVHCPSAFRTGLLKPMPTEKNKGRTLVEKHLNDYTARNTFDYFIHKDLGGFLRRELDFYIKNEVLHLDDINLDNAASYERALRMIKALKTVACKIIDLLAQIEDFQKRLWLKKKLVVQADYCITLDRIDESFYPAIAANEAQRLEWVRLFAIDELKGDVATPGYSEPLTVDFLKANPYVLVDTRFFDREWKYSLLASMDNFDEQCDGLMVNSENFQVLSFLTKRHENEIECIYIDPPYNTSASEINYKNSYKNSSWATLIENRLSASGRLLSNGGIICTTIDDFEFHRLRSLKESIFGKENFLGVTTIKNNPAGRSTAKGFSIAHEYGIYFSKGESRGIGRLIHSDEQKARYKFIDEIGPFEWVNFRKHGGANANRWARPKLFYPIFVSAEHVRFPEMEWSSAKNEWILKEQPLSHEKVVFPITPNGEEKTWKWGVESAVSSPKEFTVRKDQNGDLGVYKKARLNEEGTLPLTTWDKKEYSSTEYGTNLLTRIFGESERFAFPKSLYAVMDTLRVCNATKNSKVLDYFAGSGTTGHAVINLNREDSGKRKYILVEMGEYFNNVTKPRIQKVVYSEDWRNGKPITRNGISHCFKYLRLESYEDTLNNLQLKRDAVQQSLLSQEHFAEDYLLNYMLHVESRDSLLNLDVFKKPFGYKLKVTENNELKEQEVDLVETFNYLIGLEVASMQLIRGTVAVQGRNRKGEKVLVIWRDVEAMDSAALNEFFRKLAINTRDSEFKRIYVNGDNGLENLRTDEEQWKVVLIEEEFHKRMFEMEP